MRQKTPSVSSFGKDFTFLLNMPSVNVDKRR
jgi:hypothetical protein